ncbi:MAG: thiamine biosynthesis lipoprotein ApbE [Gemmatales bacterium]|nr:MAG: thiamine biosynthesis lipoprotein ApbE [Gemmatales bacterium]
MSRFCYIKFASAVLLLLAAFSTCPAKEEERSRPTGQLKRFTFVEAHMGTHFKIILYAKDRATAEQAAKAAFARIAQLDGIMSHYRLTSELMQLCLKSDDKPVKVSSDLFAVLWQAQKMAEQSNGAFDVTIGPVVRLWRRCRLKNKLPTPQELAQARSLVGFRNLVLDPKHQTVQLKQPGMRLDLGGIGKGFAADKAIETLARLGVDRALVSAGGDIVVSKPPPDSDGWRIGIAPLEDPDARPERFIFLADAAIATSGDAERYVEIDGIRYSHIVDPRTGLGLVGRISATVIAPDGTTADALATTLNILGEKGLPLIEKTPGASGLIHRKVDNKDVLIKSKRFPDH